MLDIPVRKLIDPWLEWAGRHIAASRITANQLTWFGFAAGLAGSWCIWQGWFGTAFALITLNRAFDGLDGCVARLAGATDLGGFLDIALDMIFYSSVPFAFALHAVPNQLPATFLIFSFMGTGSSFLAYAIISGKRGRSAVQVGKKSFFYSSGLIEGTETALFLWALCIVPQHFPVMAWTFGGLCWLTTALRVARACREFR